MADTKGYKAKQPKKDIKDCYLCRDCAEDIDTQKLEQYESKFADEYCVNCWEIIEGGGNVNLNMNSREKRNWENSVNERLCCLLDVILENIYPMIGLGPGEKPEKTKINPAITKSDHPEDATEQVEILYTGKDQRQRVKSILDKLSNSGKLVYNDYKEDEIFTAIIKE